MDFGVLFLAQELYLLLGKHEGDVLDVALDGPDNHGVCHLQSAVHDLVENLV